MIGMRHTCAPVLTQTVAETSVAQNKYEIGRSFRGFCDRAMAGSSRLYCRKTSGWFVDTFRRLACSLGRSYLTRTPFGQILKASSPSDVRVPSTIWKDRPDLLHSRGLFR